MKQIILDRRALHRIPELDRDLDRTMAYLRSALRDLHCRLFSPLPNSLCAYFDNGAATTLAFRSGADAMPVQECSFLPFASEIPGQMHSCGHDGHMAMLLELARRINGSIGKHNILLIFQPAEETTGGARDICKSGVFEELHVEAIFALQLWPDLPLGTIASRKNEIMSQSCEVTVDIRGKAISVVRAEEGKDALRAGFEFYRRAMEIADRNADAGCLLHFGRMESGVKCNVISGRTRLEGTLRAFQSHVFMNILEQLERAARDISNESGCILRIETSMGYPAVVNPPELCARVCAAGAVYEHLEKPIMITEDFSWYQRHLPGMLFLLGTGPCPPLQAADFNFDESVLETGADFLEKLALGLD